MILNFRICKLTFDFIFSFKTNYKLPWRLTSIDQAGWASCCVLKDHLKFQVQSLVFSQKQ